MMRLLLVGLLGGLVTASSVSSNERPPIGTEGPDFRATERAVSPHSLQGMERIR